MSSIRLNNGISGNPSARVLLESANVPSFILKVWNLLCENVESIFWAEHGYSFHIREVYKFSNDVLPLYFKHSNMNSFIRQLNMYGFRKVSNVQQSGMNGSNQNVLEFRHPSFVREHPELLSNIKRKAQKLGERTGGCKGPLMSSKECQTPRERPNVDAAFESLKQLQERQTRMDKKLSDIKFENRALWKELSQLRTVHVKQRDVLNRLIQFLLNVVVMGDVHHGPGAVGGRNGKGRHPSVMPLTEPDPGRSLLTGVPSNDESGIDGLRRLLVSSPDSSTSQQVISMIGDAAARSTEIIDSPTPSLVSVPETTTPSSHVQLSPSYGSAFTPMESSNRRKWSTPVKPPSLTMECGPNINLVDSESLQYQRAKLLALPVDPVWGISQGEANSSGDYGLKTAQNVEGTPYIAVGSFPDVIGDNGLLGMAMPWEQHGDDYMDEIQMDLDTLNEFVLGSSDTVSPPFRTDNLDLMLNGTRRRRSRSLSSAQGKEVIKVYERPKKALRLADGPRDTAP